MLKPQSKPLVLASLQLARLGINGLTVTAFSKSLRWQVANLPELMVVQKAGTCLVAFILLIFIIFSWGVLVEWETGVTLAAVRCIHWPRNGWLG
ncbi:MAG: hypothetical protein IPN76_17015 [Saprospiraceae bacterium]|nr:hypothetical protein [Saprospiraceae bacterium]